MRPFKAKWALENSVWCRGLEICALNLKGFCGEDIRGEMGLKINIFLEWFFLYREMALLQSSSRSQRWTSSQEQPRSQPIDCSASHTGGRKCAESQASFQCSRTAAQALQTVYENMNYIMSVGTCFIRDMSTNNLLCIISEGNRLAL